MTRASRSVCSIRLCTLVLHTCLQGTILPDHGPLGSVSITLQHWSLAMLDGGWPARPVPRL